MNQPRSKSTYLVVGVMSGTSLDGLDLAIVKLDVINDNWTYELLFGESIQYSKQWKLDLKNAISLENENLDVLDQNFGDYIGESIRNLITKENITPDFIASHGHTVFHQPSLGITRQIGSAAAIYNQTSIPVINNFRALDVSLGGQGAPLVPIGDKLLFDTYEYCLNLGGIANISFEKGAERNAFDICPFNMSLNYLTLIIGEPYDHGGGLAKTGELNLELYEQLNDIPYCQSAPPKSLGYEDFLRLWKPLLDNSKTSTINKLHTVVEHSAYQIGKTVDSSGNSILVTGGGAYNDYFISRLKAHTNNAVFVPSSDLIEFKEAIVFSLLGALKFRGDSNCLSSVTGAREDSSGGDLYGFRIK